MPHPIRIRLATRRDYQAICRLYERLDRHHVAILPKYFRPFPKPARSKTRVYAGMKKPSAVYLVAETLQGIVGFLNLKRERAPAAPMFRCREFAHLVNLAVHPKYRRMGIGTALLSAARGWTADQGLNSIQLKVYSANDSAVKFYRREGFKPLAMTMELELI